MAPGPLPRLFDRGRRGTREDGFPLVKYAARRLKRNYFGLVSTLFIDDEILFCANEQSETSKRSPVPFFSSDSSRPVVARALFSPFLRCNDVRTKDVNKSRRKRGRQWKTSDGKRRRGGKGREGGREEARQR